MKKFFAELDSFVSILSKRLKSETPPFFKKIIRLSLVLAAFSASVLGAPMLLKGMGIDGFELPAKLENTLIYVLIFSSGVVAASKATTSDPDLGQK